MNNNKLKNVLYLGPKGSYSDLATKNFAKFYDFDILFEPINSISNIVKTLLNTKNDLLGAVIPIENSVEGVVRESQDNLYLLAQNGYRITAETAILIEHMLVGYGKKNQIKKILSHHQALAQCKDYLYDNFSDDLLQVPVLSTSVAISSLNKNNPEIAAIGSFYCANLYKTPIIDKSINDEKNNSTRFLLISKIEPKKTEINKVSITFSTENKPGSLNKILSILEKYGLNMSYIDSRPSRKELGEYVFYIDFSGHIEDSNINIALDEIQSHTKMFEVLSQGAICI